MGADSPDAGLIDLCGRLVSQVAREANLALVHRDVDRDEYDALIRPVDDEWAAIEAGLKTIQLPSTLAGARAAARAAAALEPTPEHEPCAMAAILRRAACAFLAGGVA